MVDRNELKACMARLGLSQQDLSKKIGISNTSLVLKMQGKRQFNEKEISVLVDLFGNSILIMS